MLFLPLHTVFPATALHITIWMDRMSIFIQINIWTAISLEHARQLPHGCWTYDNVAMGISTGTVHKAHRHEVLPAVLNICIVCVCLQHTHTYTKHFFCLEAKSNEDLSGTIRASRRHQISKSETEDERIKCVLYVLKYISYLTNVCGFQHIL